jgi:hypothetical protein
MSKAYKERTQEIMCVTVYIHTVNNMLISTGAVISGNIKNLKCDKDKANIPSHDNSGNWSEM